MMSPTDVNKRTDCHVFEFRKDVECPTCNKLPVTFANMGNLCEEHRKLYELNTNRNVRFRRDRI